MSQDEQSNASIRRPLPLPTRLAELATGVTAFKLLNYPFDYALYPLIIYQLGIIKGGLIMTFLAAAANLFCLKFYDWSKRDWLGIETLKGLKGYDGNSRLARFTAGLLQKGDLVAFLFLSIKEDAFITMIYLRHGSHQFNGMSRRDWRIFLASLLVANLYWTLAAYMGVSLVTWGWKFLR
jgi:hypothetical protein